MFESEAIEDIVKSVKEISELPISFISINPTTVHSYTLLDKLWWQHEYRPPWLWSILEALEQIDAMELDIKVICDLVNPGKVRGPHNCGRCDKRLIKVIKQFTVHQSLSTSIKKIKKLKQCRCYSYWKAILKTEEFLGYPQRFEYKKPSLPRKYLD